MSAWLEHLEKVCVADVQIQSIELYSSTGLRHRFDLLQTVLTDLTARPLLGILPIRTKHIVNEPRV